MSRCSECGSPVIWNQDAVSNICTACGTLTDSSQYVLAVTSDEQRDSQYFNTSVPNTLKRFRGGYSWNLAGQSKELRLRNNSYVMHEYIKSLTRTLSIPGLSPRVCTLFDQAMGTARFRWGTKAKMVAGACLSIAVRETGRPDFLKDIAFLIEQSELSVKRTLSSVLAALNLTLPPTGPVQFLSTLQAHLAFILQSPAESSGLNISLYSELKSLSVRSTAETARLFINSLTRLSPPEISFSQLSPAAVACAVFIMSLEAEKRGPFSHLDNISASFAKCCQVAAKTVSQRYQALQDVVAKWTEEVEWLDSYQKSGGRAKASKRLLCARGLKDALNWKDRLWEKRMARGLLHLQVGSDSETECESSSNIVSPFVMQPSWKKKKVHRAISDATVFLLGPETDSPGSSLPPDCTSSREKSSPDAFTMSSYLLSVPSTSSMQALPSRLQQLAVARGGSGLDVIHDDELLLDGEWETVLRTPEEIQVLEQRWRDEGVFELMEKAHAAALEKHNKQMLGCLSPEEAQARANSLTTGTVRSRASKRINLEAFSEFMSDNLDEYDQAQTSDLDVSEMLGLEVLEDDKDLDEDAYELYGVNPGLNIDGGEFTVDDWRPPSPGFNSSFDDDYS